MVQGLAELVAACRQGDPKSHAASIADGVEQWFIGHPVAADPGTVALAQSPEIRLIFREEDIRAVQKHGERYLVRIAPDASMLIRHEQVMKASQSRCHCGPEEDGGKPGAMRRERGRIDPDADVNFIEVMPCWWRFNCYTINIPLLGPTRVCIPTGLWCS